MAVPIAHLPLPLTMSISFNGDSYEVGQVDVPIPLKTQPGMPGEIRLALDTPEMQTALRRAINAFDDAFHTKEN